jgi:hypothetical protein
MIGEASAGHGVVRLLIIVPGQPGIAPDVQPPAPAWSRIQATTASHQPLGDLVGADAVVHALQVASILAGSVHIVDPVM